MSGTHKTWGNWIRALACLLVALGLYAFPVPEGLSPTSWLYLALFTAVILGTILGPLPPSLVSLLGLLAACLLRIGPPGSLNPISELPIPIGDISSAQAVRWALSGFSSPFIWLIFTMFMVGSAYEKTGLGTRIGLFFIQKFGRSTLGLGYAVALTEGLLAPFLLSSTARSAGVVYPIVMGIPPLLNSSPTQEPRKIGAYLVWVAFTASCVSSSLFLTAFLPNIMALDVLQRSSLPMAMSFASVNWKEWLLVSAPTGGVLLLLTPLLAYWFYPPALKYPGGMVPLEKRLKLPQPSGKKQICLVLITGIALGLWSIGETLGLDALMTSLCILFLLVACRTLEWEDVIGHKKAWNTLLWMGSMLTLTGGLEQLDIFDYCVSRSSFFMSGLVPAMFSLSLIIVFFLAHYLVVGGELQANILFPLVLAVAAGMPDITPVQLTELIFALCFSLGVMGVLTPYGTGQGAVWFASGYVKNGEFWFLGAVFGAIYLAGILFILIPWLRLSGIGE